MCVGDTPLAKTEARRDPALLHGARAAAGSPRAPPRAARSAAPGGRGGCCGLSPNARALVVTSCLFSAIVFAQFVGAYLSRSRALLLDSVSMMVDVSTYGANLWTECAPASSARRAEAREVVVAGLSLLALWTVTLIGTAQAIVIIHARALAADAPPAPPDAAAAIDARIVLGFALVGLAVDAVSLLEIRRTGTQAAGAAAAERAGGPTARLAAQLEHAPSEAAAPDADGGAPPSAAAGGRRAAAAARHGARAWCARACCVLELNMSSALAHVLADTFRSSTTLVASVLILGAGWDGELVDGSAAIIVAAAIVLVAMGTTRRWAVACWRFVAAPPPAPLATREARDDGEAATSSADEGERGGGLGARRAEASAARDGAAAHRDGVPAHAYAVQSV